jgi:prepilin-type processing-associated H-X9-DG protein
MEEPAVYELMDFSEYATHEVNQPAINTAIPVFNCPSTPRSSLTAHGLWVGRGKLDVDLSAAVIDYCSTEGVVEGNECVPGGWGEMAGNQALEITFAHIEDGLSNTLLIVERAGLPDMYTEGGANFTPHQPPRFRTWGNVGLWAISAEFLTNHITPDFNHPLVNYDNFKGLYSFHAGGIHVALADGSVRLLGDMVENATLIALVTRDGGEVVDPHSVP